LLWSWDVDYEDMHTFKFLVELQWSSVSISHIPSSGSTFSAGHHHILLKACNSSLLKIKAINFFRISNFAYYVLKMEWVHVQILQFLLQWLASVRSAHTLDSNCYFARFGFGFSLQVGRVCFCLIFAALLSLLLNWYVLRDALLPTRFMGPKVCRWKILQLQFWKWTAEHSYFLWHHKI